MYNCILWTSFFLQIFGFKTWKVKITSNKIYWDNHFLQKRFCNCVWRKTFSYVFLVWVFLLYLPFVSVFGMTARVFLFTFSYIVTQDACDQCRANLIGLTEKDSVRRVSLVLIRDASGSWQAIYFSLFTVTSIHSIQRGTRNRNSETK